MNDARQRILQRLRHNRPAQPTPEHRTPHHQGWTLQQMIGRFSERQHAVRGEVHHLADGDWLGWLRKQLPARGLVRLLAGADHAQTLPGLAALPGIELHAYERPIEDWKAELFDGIDAAITRCHAGIAETGSLVLWPTAHEPRLMSLVPPVHIALLQASQLHESFAALIETQDWASGMPTNALLISGPSKTADIEQTLAYGIHGPRQLITLILG